MCVCVCVCVCVCYTHSRVPGEIKRREVELGCQVSPEEITSRGGGAGLRKVDFFCFGLFLNSSATDIVLVTQPSMAVETAIAQCTSRWAMARGHRLNTSIVLAAVHGLSGLFWAVSAVGAITLSPLVPVPNKQPRFCGRKANMVKVKPVGAIFQLAFHQRASRQCCISTKFVTLPVS